MIRRILFVVILLCIGLGVLVYVRVSAIQKAEGEVRSRFNEMIVFYRALSSQYIQPLLALPNINESLRTDLDAIATQLDTLQKVTEEREQHQRLFDVQRAMNSFFHSSSLTEEITSEPHFVSWNKEASNRGEASSLLHRYNTSLASYNAQRQTVFGRLLKYKKSWSQSEYLSTDGTTQQQPEVRF